MQKPTPAPLFNFRKRQRQAILSDPLQIATNDDQQSLSLDTKSSNWQNGLKNSFESYATNQSTVKKSSSLSSNSNNQYNPKIQATNPSNPESVDTRRGYNRRRGTQNNKAGLIAPPSMSRINDTTNTNLNRGGANFSSRGFSMKERGGTQRGTGTGRATSEFSKTVPFDEPSTSSNSLASTSHKSQECSNKIVFTAQNNGFQTYNPESNSFANKRGNRGAGIRPAHSSRGRGTSQTATATFNSNSQDNYPGPKNSDTGRNFTSNNSFKNNFPSNSTSSFQNSFTDFDSNKFNIKKRGRAPAVNSNTRGAMRNYTSPGFNMNERVNESRPPLYNKQNNALGQHQQFGSSGRGSNAESRDLFQDNEFDSEMSELLGNTSSAARNQQNKSSGNFVESEQSSMRVFTCPIAAIKEWTNLHLSLGTVMFEVYGIIDSAALPDRTGTGKEFMLRDDTDTMNCVFYEIDRELPRPIRGQVHRLIGNMLRKSNLFRAVSVRPSDMSERQVCQQATKVSLKEMERLANEKEKHEQ